MSDKPLFVEPRTMRVVRKNNSHYPMRVLRLTPAEYHDYQRVAEEWDAWQQRIAVGERVEIPPTPEKQAELDAYFESTAQESRDAEAERLKRINGQSD